MVSSASRRDFRKLGSSSISSTFIRVTRQDLGAMSSEERQTHAPAVILQEALFIPDAPERALPLTTSYHPRTSTAEQPWQGPSPYPAHRANCTNDQASCTAGCRVWGRGCMLSGRLIESRHGCTGILALAIRKLNLNDPITRHLHQDFTRLDAGQTVGQALESLRLH